MSGGVVERARLGRAMGRIKDKFMVLMVTIG
jgi:hypothetical protein